MSRSRIFAVVGVLGVGAIVACGSKSSDAPAPSGGEGAVVLAQGVVVLEGSTVDDVKVLPGELRFPAARHADIASKKAGDVLVGDRGTSAGSPNKHGFLRKVVSISNDGADIVVKTEQAELGDVIQEGELKGLLEVPSLVPGEDGDAASPAPGTKSGPGFTTKGGPIKVLDFSGKSLFASAGSVEVEPGKTIGYDASVTLTKGRLDFTPTFDVGAKVGKLGFSLKGLIKEAHVIATGKLDAVAEIDARLKLTGTATGDDVAALIAKKIFKASSTTIADHTIKLPSLKLGFISVPAHANFKAVVKCDLRWGGETGVVVGAKATATISAGAKYDGSKIEPVWKHSASLEQTGPVWTITNDVFLKCAIVPELSLNLWDVASGEIKGEAYAALGAKATCNEAKLTGDVTGEAYAGVSAKAHAKLSLFGLYKWEKECTLFDLHSPKAKVSGSFPLGKGATCTPVPDMPPPPPVEAPPPACFGGTSTPPDPGTDAGLPGLDSGLPGVDAGGSSDAGDASSETPDSGAGCDHDSCTIGKPLGPTCTKDGQAGACIKSICENDSYCCEFAWTASCVAHVENGDFACAKKKCGP